MLSIVLFPLVVTMIVFHSTKIKKYRYYILNSSVWNIMFATLCFFIRPIPLFPSMCWILDPRIALSYNATLFFGYFIAFSALNLDLSIAASLLYRYSQAFHGRFVRLLDYSPWTELFYISFHIAVYFLLFVPMSLGQTTPGNETQLQFAIENPDLIEQFGQKTIVCFANTERSRRIVLFLGCVLFFFFFVGSAFFGRFAYTICCSKNHSAAYKLQLMLFKFLTVQLYTGYVCLVFPVCLAILFLYLQNPYAGRYAIVAMTLESVHSWIDYSCIIFFITPYRESLLKLFRLRPIRTSQLFIVSELRSIR
ncbi:hypothetical protein M3Y98_00053800 [Aphelenchoides besseyi]|nr:hypothetical protein M3Y98_00053800 [Aphelenchoides besseyi]